MAFNGHHRQVFSCPCSFALLCLCHCPRLQLAGYYTLLFSANANFSHKPYPLIVLSTTPSLNAVLSVRLFCLQDVRSLDRPSSSSSSQEQIIPKQKSRNIIPQFVARTEPTSTLINIFVVVFVCGASNFPVIKPTTEHQSLKSFCERTQHPKHPHRKRFSCRSVQNLIL